MTEPKDFGPIYGRLLGNCLPYIHGKPWHELPPFGDLRRLPASPDAMISDLRQEFSDAQLQEAGVVVMDEDMVLQPDPLLCKGDGPVIAMRKKPTEDPFELVTDQGTLSGRMLPVCASLRDGRVRKMIETTDDNLICAATTVADMAVLMSLEIPATLTTGLAELSGSHLKLVQHDFQLYPPKRKPQDRIIYEDDEEKKEKVTDLVLVGCSLAALSLDKPEGLSEIASHLADVEEYLDVPLERFYIWNPTKKAIKQIGFCLKHADRQKVRAVILESIDSSTGQLITPRKSSQDDSPKSLEDALQRFMHLRSKPRRNIEDEQRAWEDIQRLIKRESLTPLQEAAEDAADPIERDFWRLATMNGRVLYPQLTRMILKSNTENKNAVSGKLMAFSDKEFRQVMQLAEGHRKILKDLADYQKNPGRRWK